MAVPRITKVVCNIGLGEAPRNAKLLDQVGYHCKDYFLKQWDRFQHVPGGIAQLDRSDANAERLPPRGVDASREIEGARLCAAAGMGSTPAASSTDARSWAARRPQMNASRFCSTATPFNSISTCWRAKAIASCAAPITCGVDRIE